MNFFETNQQIKKYPENDFLDEHKEDENFKEMIELRESHENMMNYSRNNLKSPKELINFIISNGSLPQPLIQWSFKSWLHYLSDETIISLHQSLKSFIDDRHACYCTFHRKLENPNEIISVRFELNEDLYWHIQTFLNVDKNKSREILFDLFKAVRILKLDNEFGNAIGNENLVEVSRLIEEEEEVDVNYRNVSFLFFSFLFFSFLFFSF